MMFTRSSQFISTHISLLFMANYQPPTQNPSTTTLNPPMSSLSSGSIPAMPKVKVAPNSDEEKQLLQNLAQRPYGAKPVLLLNELDTKNNPDIEAMTPIALQNGSQGYFQQVHNRPTSTVEFVLPLFPDTPEMHLSNNVLLNGTIEKKKKLTDLQAKGITVDTVVTQDHFALNINGPAGQEKDLIAIGLDFLGTPSIDEKEYESSRTLVMQNLLNLSNKPDFQKAETVQRARIGDDHPYGKSTLKTILEVKNLDPQSTIQEFKSSYAHPELTQVAMVSGLSATQQAALFNSLAEEKNWKTDSQTPVPKSLVNMPPVVEKKLDAPILISDNRLDRVHMSTLWKAPEVGNPDYPKFVMMKNLMGGMTGSLFKTMRTERGLVYSTSSGVEANKNYGEYEVSAEIDTDKLPNAMEGLNDAINTYVNIPPTDEELAKAKRRVIHSMREQEASSEGLIASTTTRLRDGLPPMSRNELQARYLNVTAGDVQSVAKQYLGDGSWKILALTGPEDVLTKTYPNAPMIQREHYLTDNVDSPQHGHIYVKKGEEPMYPAEYVVEKQDASIQASTLVKQALNRLA